MTKGIAKTDFRQKFGCAIETVYGDVLKKYEAMGLLLEKDGRIFLSREGIHVSNSVMADFYFKRLDEHMFLRYTECRFNQIK